MRKNHGSFTSDDEEIHPVARVIWKLLSEWGFVLAILALIAMAFLVGDKEWSILFGTIVFPWGWKFPGFCQDVPQTPFECRFHHEGNCAGVISCLQSDVDDCVHMCEIGIYSIKDKKRTDSNDPPWTVPIQEVKCKNCTKMIPYVGDPAHVALCWDCRDMVDFQGTEMIKEEE